MVIDKSGIIQEGATEITKDFFGMDPAGKELSEVLRLDEGKTALFKKWTQNIYRGVLSFKDLKQLGPPSFEADGYYIDLDYKPIYVEGSKRKIDKVICVATDKTKEIVLERKIEFDKQKAEFITSCLNNPVEFIDLLEDSYSIVESFPVIKAEDQGELFRKFHTLKARYGQFGAKELTNYINDVETTIYKGDIDHLDDKVHEFHTKIQKFVKNEIFNICSGKAIHVRKVVQFLSTKTKFNKIFPRKNNKIEVIKTHGENRKILKVIGKIEFEDLYNKINQIIKWHKKYKELI